MRSQTLYDFARADVFDSRDVIERIEELDTGDDDDNRRSLSDEELDELAVLLEFVKEAGDHLSDWEFGETFIRDSYFEDYARELAEDCGYLGRDDQNPLLSHIDWEGWAAAVQQDYTAFELDGITFWARS